MRLAFGQILLQCFSALPSGMAAQKEVFVSVKAGQKANIEGQPIQLARCSLFEDQIFGIRRRAAAFEAAPEIVNSPPSGRAVYCELAYDGF
jgi:hypothetical protein